MTTLRLLISFYLVGSSLAKEFFPWFDEILTENRREDSFAKLAQNSITSYLRSSFLSSDTEYSSGWVYYDFYSTVSCSGNVTYSSGIPINTCIPGDIYARPDDDQADEYKPYDAFKVVDVTSSCSFTAIFYTDVNCTKIYNTQAPSIAFPYCNILSSSPATPLVSYQGKCTGSTKLPLSVSSYVFSTFSSDNEQCAGQASQYQAYALDLCYGTDATKSLLYSYASKSSYIAMHNYYGSNNCTSTPYDYQQNTLNLTLGCTNSGSSAQSNATSSELVEVYIIVDDDSTTTDDSSTSSLSDGEVAGIVIGTVVGSAALVGVGVYVYSAGTASALLGGTAAGTSGGVAGGSAGGVSLSAVTAEGTTSTLHNTNAL